MRRLATTLALAAFLALPATLWAQVNQSTVYARDVAGATMTLDGALTESVWQQAEKLEFKWNMPPAGYSSGQQLEGSPTLAEPTDPLDATAYFLRDGNTLWIGIDARDKSIWGNRSDFFNNDGIIMAMQDRTSMPVNMGATAWNRFGGGIAEFIYNWRNPTDTTATGAPAPGAEPRFVGTYSDRSNPRNVAIWNAMTTVNGTSNTDDTEDTGYVMEMMIRLDSLGFDFTQPGGDQVGFSLAVGDRDFNTDDNLRFGQRVFFESKWGNTFHGIGWLAGSPEVTVNSGTTGMTPVAPDLVIPRLSDSGTEPTIDGSLDEAAWGMVEPAFSLKYRDQDVLGDFPGVGLSSIRYFRPTPAGADANAPILDPSKADYKMFYKGDRLYVGVSVDDQALSGVASEGGRDGFRLVFDRADTTRSDGMPFQVRFDFALAPGDTLQFDGDVAVFKARFPGFLESAVDVMGTIDDPNDVDTGYTIELSIDLKALGYASGLGNHMVYLTPGFFDGDFLQDATTSYTYRIWYGRERGQPGVPLFAFLDENTVLRRSGEGTPGEDLVVYGARPNPATGAATIHYDLPEVGEVRIDVYDLLGRRVATLDAGVQGTGAQRAAFDGTTLAAGMYLYRVNVRGVSGTTHAATGRFVLAR